MHLPAALRLLVVLQHSTQTGHSLFSLSADIPTTSCGVSCGCCHCCRNILLRCRHAVLFLCMLSASKENAEFRRVGSC